MYKVGEYIVHPGQGVCRVDEIVEEPQAIYLLLPIGSRHPMRISYPVSGEGRLRPILTHREAEELVAEYPSLPFAEASGKGGNLEEEHYRDRIRHGSCRDSVRIVKTFRARIEELRSRNKRPPVAYERILKQASQRSLEELAVALGTTPEEVVSLFESQGDGPVLDN